MERLVAEAESHAAEDAAWRELVEVKNAAEAAAHAARSMLAEHEEKIPEADRAEAEAAAKALEEASQGEDKQAIQERLNELQQVSMRIGAAIHQAAQGEGGDGQEAQEAQGAEGAQTDEGLNGAGSSGAADADGVVDADFHEVGEEDGVRH